MVRSVKRLKRFWNCVPPHSSMAGCQLVGDEPGGAGDGARVPGAVGEVVAEQVALVGDDEDVVVRRALGEGRDLLLDLLEAAVGAAAAGSYLKVALLDDLGAEALGGAPQGVGEELVLLGCGPSTRNQCGHCFQTRYWASASASMVRVGAVCITLAAAILLAQPVVGRAVVDDERRPCPCSASASFSSVVGRHVGDDEMRARVDLLHDVLDQLGGIGALRRRRA